MKRGIHYTGVKENKRGTASKAKYIDSHLVRRKIKQQ